MRRVLGQLITEFNGAFPQAVGACAGDVGTIAGYANQAQQELLNSGGETGWFGCWQRVIFNVLQCDPYITLPATFARIINMDVCRTPYRIQNEFYEFLPAGIGWQGPLNGVIGRQDWCGAFQGFERGVFPTFIDLTPANQYLTVFLTNPADVGKSIVFQNAIDQNGNPIYEQDGTNSIVGTSLTFQTPSVTSQMIVTGFSGIEKDQTVGDILLYQTDATTGAQILLSRYSANETNPAYRRYYIKNLPCTCSICPPISPCLVQTPQPKKVQVTAMCKLEYFPALRLTDPLIIGNIPALIEYAKHLRYRTMDSPDALAQAASHKAQALKLLNQELVHYLGRETIAVNFAPEGTARLQRKLFPVRFG